MDSQLIAFTFLGIVLGSFGNVLIQRIPKGQPIAGWSRCPRCYKRIALFDLVPIVSFIMLGGQCRICERHISWRYPLVELLSGTVFYLAYTHTTALLYASLLAVSLWLLLLITAIDAETQGIPDVLSIPFIIVSAILSFTASSVDMWALVIGVGFFGAQWVLSRGKWIGSGDVLLMVGISVLLARWEHVVLMIFLSYLLGAVVASGMLIARHKTHQDHLAFGPFLAVATVIVLFWGPELLRIAY